MSMKPAVAATEEAQPAVSHHLIHLVPARSVAAPQTFYTKYGKRLLDFVVASTLLLLLVPSFLVMGAVISCTSSGGAIFTQVRVGRFMTPFRCLKFRTMVENADSILHENPQLRDAMAMSWKIPDDPRVTSIGRRLRAHSLDELPQLFNVVMGDMSLVGPRPYLPHELSGDFGPHAVGITSVRPGMTGLWQVSGRSHLSPVDRVALDEQYVVNCCFRTDLELLLRTVWIVFNRKGAY